MSIRQVLAPIIGVVIGSVVVAVIETAGQALFRMPAPSGRDAAAWKTYVSALPPAALVTVLVGWWLGTFAGAWSGVRLAGRRPALHAAIVTCVLLLATVANLVMLPHPLWMSVLGPLGILWAGWLALRLRAAPASLR